MYCMVLYYCLCAINIIMYQQIHTILLCIKEVVIAECKSLMNKLKQLNKLKGTKAIVRLRVLGNVLLMLILCAVAGLTAH